MKSVSLEEMAVLLKKMDNYRIIYHIRPDGDCIGSAYALALSLQSVIFNSSAPCRQAPRRKTTDLSCLKNKRMGNPTSLVMRKRLEISVI